jgi:hypothetical protein
LPFLSFLFPVHSHKIGVFQRRVAGMRIEEVITAPHSPWQNSYAERLIGSIRRECLDHVIIFSEEYLRRILKRYFLYYHNSRPHQALDQNAPIPRTVESGKKGPVISIPRSVACITGISEQLEAGSVNMFPNADRRQIQPQESA